MKAWLGVFLLLFVCASAFPQTTSLGLGLFSCDENKIMMMVDAGFANLKTDGPYVLFKVWMMSKDGESMEFNRDDVVMHYKGQEYNLVPFEEIRKNNETVMRDLFLYGRVWHPQIRYSIVRFHSFPSRMTFFPTPGSLQLRVDKGFLGQRVGFSTYLFFKNPGFKKGDDLVIEVKDRNISGIAGSVAAVIQ